MKLYPVLNPKAITLLRATQESILKEPQLYNQGNPCVAHNHCGSPACICGWMAYHAGLDDYADDGSNLFLTFDQYYSLFFIANWPYEYLQQHENATTDKARAKVAYNRINHFIETDGQE